MINEVVQEVVTCTVIIFGSCCVAFAITEIFVGMVILTKIRSNEKGVKL